MLQQGVSKADVQPVTREEPSSTSHRWALRTRARPQAVPAAQEESL